MKSRKKENSDLVPISNALDGLEDLFVDQGERGVWAEPQLYLLPFCVPQDRTAERFRKIKISESVKVGDQMKHRSFIVNPHPELGLPGSFELEVMTGIYRLADMAIKKNGFVPEFIEIGTFRAFLESIGRPGNGKYIQMVKEALRRLAGTTCISEGFFYSKPRNLYVVESFTFITSLQIAGESDFSGSYFERTRIKLHEFIRENLNSNFRTLIDFAQLRKFKTDIAKTLSMHIAYRTFKNKKSQWIVDYDWLAERLAIRVYEELKAAKKQMRPALIELQENEFIQSWEWIDGRKLVLTAGRQLLEAHKRRVEAKDAWIDHEQEKSRCEKLITNQTPRTVREAERVEAFDPLAVLCTEYAVRGWDAIARKALARGLDEETLKDEAQKRGHTIQ